MAILRGPSIVYDSLILLADPANPKSNGGSATMDDIHGTWSDTAQGTSSLTLSSSNPKHIINDGTGGSIIYSRSPYINWALTNFTFCCWGKRTNHSDSRQGRMFDLTNAGNGHMRLTLAATPSLVQRPSAGSGSTLISGGSTTAGNWYNITVTKLGGESGGTAAYKLYINGVEAASNSSSALVTDSNFTYIRTMRSADDDQPSISWLGDFGPLLVYDTVLSADQVLQNFNAYKSRYNI